MEERSNLFLAIDANAIVHRAYHAFPATLSNAEGVPINAVYGFTSMLLRVLDEFKPRYIVCAFDTAKPTFRHTKFVDYKAHRKPTDQSLIDQFPLVEDVLKVFNIPILKKEGYEADDILGSLADCVEKGKWRDYNLDMVIVSGDRDLLQLINGNIRVCLPAGSFKNLSVFDRNLVREKYGYYPEQVIDYKALVGDPSDNIPGVKGIGDKSALEMLQKYGNLNGIYKNLTELKPRLQTLLGEGVEQAEMSRELATISRDVDIIPELESALMKDFDRTKVVELFKKFEFRSLMDKIPENGSDKEDKIGQMNLFGGPESVESESGEVFVKAVQIDISDKKSIQAFKESVNACKESRFIYVAEEESLDGEAFLVFGFVDKSGQLSVFVSSINYDLVRISFTKSNDCETYFYNWEGFVSRVIREGYPIGEYISYDIKILTHLTSAGQKGYQFGDLVYKFTGSTISNQLARSEAGKYVTLMAGVNQEVMKKLSEIAEDKEVLDFIKRINNRKINSEKVAEYLNKSEIDTSKILGLMENRGLLLNLKLLEKIAEELAERLVETEKNIYDSVGHQFNINSPKQLAEVLYDELQLPSGRGKSGRTTQEAKLSKLRALHPVVSSILNYRELSKLQNTYVQPFMDAVRPAIQKGEPPIIHTDFNQAGASSGRFSSNNPNMQNLPARGEWAPRFREVFVPRDGFQMVSIDYSQIDLRVMAHVSNDHSLAQDFKEEKDIHLETAVRIFDKQHDQITSDERAFGKTINFGVLYGQTKYGLSRMLGISTEDAEKYIKIYFENYKGVAEYVSQATIMAQEKGYVQTLMGRRRYIAGLNSKNRQAREAAVREAINMPIQGGSADIMKLAMLAVYDLIFDSYKDQAFLLLQIHDELMFEVVDSKVEKFREEASKIMEGVVKLNVPLKVSAGHGMSMAELK